MRFEIPNSKKFHIFHNPNPKLSAPRRGHLRLVLPLSQTALNKEQSPKKGLDYQYSEMDLNSLLEEMIRFQGEHAETGKLTTSMIKKGIPLFKALEERAETQELKTLTRSYRRHLEFELKYG